MRLKRLPRSTSSKLGWAVSRALARPLASSLLAQPPRSTPTAYPLATARAQPARTPPRTPAHPPRTPARTLAGRRPACSRPRVQSGHLLPRTPTCRPHPSRTRTRPVPPPARPRPHLHPRLYRPSPVSTTHTYAWPVSFGTLCNLHVQ
ncbi:hypothetical protein B0H14DRAFT_3498764 [Mycena olivaceomarginata]|nr:hypothetical protein B0H14DRAFT_3498764 [Mycena olivaceomarginata]